MPTSGISLRVSAISRFMSSTLTGVAHAGAPCSGAASRPVRQNCSAASVAISAGSSPY